MPEGPEVTLMCDELQAISGLQMSSFEFFKDGFKISRLVSKFLPQLVGQKLCSVFCVGKIIFMDFGDNVLRFGMGLHGGLSLAQDKYSLFSMTFSVDNGGVIDSDENDSKDSIVFTLGGRGLKEKELKKKELYETVSSIADDSSCDEESRDDEEESKDGGFVCVYYSDMSGFGNVSLLSSEEALDCIEGLGFDVLNENLSELVDTQQARTYSCVKQLLLDQCVVAGVGNYLANEILWHHGSHPDRPVMTMSDEELVRLFDICFAVAKESYDSCGSSSYGGGYMYKVYQQATCPLGHAVTSVVDGRKTYICECMKKIE